MPGPLKNKEEWKTRDQKPQPLSKAHSKGKSRKEWNTMRQPSMKSHPGEQMGFRVLEGREEKTSDPSVPRLGVLLKMMARETESQF